MYYNKYLKYKNKYNLLKGGADTIILSNKSIWYDEDYISQIRKFNRSKYKYTNNGVKAILVPHASLKYSGNTANIAYSLVDYSEYDLIILLSTLHNSNKNIYAPESSNIKYNDITIKISDIRHNIKNIVLNDEEFNKEHSWQMQILFLCYYSKNIEILPLLVGNIDNFEETASELLGKTQNKKVLFVINSDFIHFGKNYNYPNNYESILNPVEWITNRDNKNVELILCNDINRFENVEDNICGINTILLWMYINTKLNCAGTQVASDISNKTEINKSYVSYRSLLFVSKPYSIFALTNNNLTEIPRTVMRLIYILNSNNLKDILDSITKLYRIKIAKAGIFVTCKSNKLNGCIGKFYDEAQEDIDIINIIIEYTIKSVFDDSRFTYEESPLRNINNIPAILSDFKFSINYLDKNINIYDLVTNKNLELFNAFLIAYKPCLHGILLEYNNNSATFLPLVMLEQGWLTSCENISNKEQFISDVFGSLLRKMKLSVEEVNLLTRSNANIYLYKGTEYNENNIIEIFG